MARKTRAGASGSASAAASIEGTRIQRSPGPAAQGARSSATSAVPVAAQASTAFRLICAANGWVASMTWVMPSSRM